MSIDEMIAALALVEDAMRLQADAIPASERPALYCPWEAGHERVRKTRRDLEALATK